MESNRDFQAAEAFDGSRAGYFFQMGPKGLGYYSDPTTGAPAPEAEAAADEEIDIDGGDDEEGVVQMQVPAAVFGAAGIGEAAGSNRSFDIF